MNKNIRLEKDLIIDGEMLFFANKTYKVHYNGTSNINREFIVSDVNGRGLSLFSMPCKYEII